MNSATRSKAVYTSLILAIMTGSLTVSYAQASQPAEPPSSGRVSLHLIPQPREVSKTDSHVLADGCRVVMHSTAAEDVFTRQDLTDALKLRKVVVEANDHERSKSVTIELMRLAEPGSRAMLEAAKVSFDEPMKTEGYAIVTTKAGIAVIAATSDGLFYGAQTVKQLITGSGRTATLVTGTIRDWPAMRYRGTDDDLSRGPVPTLEFQEHQVKTLAAFKINIYSPYFENTFAYKSNPLSASPGGAMTAADYAELVRYAQQYHVTVVPEQEAFGHLHNVLTYEQYADLAETPHGSVLAPGSARVLPLIKQWFTELAAETPGPFLHIGADETFDLGKGKTHEEVKQRGLGPVYIDFLKQIDAELKPLNKRILFWGDIAVSESKLVPELPKDMIAIPWDYDANPKGYEHEILPFKQAGMETWVAPGVSNWSRVYPNNNLALPNIQGFIRDGQHLGSTGALNTVWNDDGEGLFNMDWYGVLFGAAASWQAGESSIADFEKSYGETFHGDSTGDVDQAQLELMQAEALLTKIDDGGASDELFWVDPWSADGLAIAPKIRPIVHDLRLHAERALVLLANAQASQSLRQPEALAAMELGARRIDMIGLKFQLSDEISATYARALQAKAATPASQDVDPALYDISDTNGRCQDLRNAYALTRDLYEAAWLRENRPFWLHNVLARYDLAIELWTRRGYAVSAALNQWHRDHTLPDAATLGIPPVTP